jgi:hypothetical protein
MLPLNIWLTKNRLQACFYTVYLREIGADWIMSILFIQLITFVKGPIKPEDILLLNNFYFLPAVCYSKEKLGKIISTLMEKASKYQNIKTFNISQT